MRKPLIGYRKEKMVEKSATDAMMMILEVSMREAIEKAKKDWSPLTNNRIYLTLKALKEQLKKHYL